MDTLISSMNSLFTYVLTIFETVFTTITSNPVLYLPVLLAFASVVIMWTIGFVRRLGVRGMGGGRRRRRR